jgi:hypothetical protein
MSSDFLEPRDAVDPGDVLDPADEATLDAELEASEQVVRRQIGSGLAELVSAPPDLATRTAAGVGDALLTRSTLAAALDLLGVGWHTVRYLAGDPEPAMRKETEQ